MVKYYAVWHDTTYNGLEITPLNASSMSEAIDESVLDFDPEYDINYRNVWVFEATDMRKVDLTEVCNCFTIQEELEIAREVEIVTEQRERAEYKRLKKKFEGKKDGGAD